MRFGAAWRARDPELGERTAIGWAGFGALASALPIGWRRRPGVVGRGAARDPPVLWAGRAL